MNTAGTPGFPPNYAEVTPSDDTVFPPSNIRVGTGGTIHFNSEGGQEGTETFELEVEKSITQ